MSGASVRVVWGIRARNGLHTWQALQGEDEARRIAADMNPPGEVMKQTITTSEWEPED